MGLLYYYFGNMWPRTREDCNSWNAVLGSSYHDFTPVSVTCTGPAQDSACCQSVMDGGGGLRSPDPHQGANYWLLMDAED